MKWVTFFNLNDVICLTVHWAAFFLLVNQVKKVIFYINVRKFELLIFLLLNHFTLTIWISRNLQYFWQFSPTVCAYYCMNWPRHHRRLIWNTTPWVSNSFHLLWKFVDGHIFLQDVEKLENSNRNHCFVYSYNYLNR